MAAALTNGSARTPPSRSAFASMVRPLISARKLLTLPISFNCAICALVAGDLSTTLRPTVAEDLESASDGDDGEAGSVASSVQAPRASRPARARTVTRGFIGSPRQGKRKSWIRRDLIGGVQNYAL